MKKPNIDDIYPLSPLQEGMLFYTLLEPGRGLYLDQIVTQLEDPRGLDLAAFRFACRRLVERHSILRTVFAWNRERPLQIVLRCSEIPIAVLDWRPLPEALQRQEIERFLREDRRCGFDLAAASPIRLTLVRRTDLHYDLAVTYHHALIDAWSVPIVFGELRAFYEARRRGEELHPPRARLYRDYIAWLEKRDQRAAETFWRRELAGFAAPTPLGIDGNGNPGGEHGETGIALSTELTGALEELARAVQATASSLIQAAWALLLSRYSGEREVLFGITVSGRPPQLEGVESMVGLFINTLPLRVRVEPEKTLGAWIRGLLARSFALQLHEHTPLTDIRRWIGWPMDLPLFESIVVFENVPGLQLDGAASREEGFGAGESRYLARSHYPLALVARPGRSMTVQILYDCSRFELSAIDRMLRHLIQLLSAFPGSLERPLAGFALLSGSESEQVLREWNATETAYPRHLCVHELFAGQAERQPVAVAVVCGEEVLTYGDLHRRASAVARELRRRGARPEELIGLLAGRSPAALAGMLGILQAGAAYLPLDPAWPRERLELVVRMAGVTIVLSENRSASLGPGDLPVEIVRLDTRVAAGGEEPISEIPAGISSDRLVYVMFTSGSTGVPKGVAVPHSSVVRLVCATNFLRLTPRSVVLHAAPLAFDASTLEIWGPLLNGGRLVILPAGFSLAELAATVRRHRVDTLWLTAGLFHEMIDQQDLADLTGVVHFLSGGDVLSPAHVRRLLAEIPGCEVINGYGPTENTTFTATFSMTAPEEAWDPVPIGRPIANTQVYLLDADFQAVPIGVPAELLAGGEGLARGYHGRPDLTAERFVPHPFSTDLGARLYRTGDIARYREDGVLEFLGRSDRQVKIRGFRVEPREVEAALARHPGVREAVVLALGSPPSGKRLVAFLTLREGAAPTAGELREALARQLPAALVPEAFVFRDCLPLTPNGKVDRKALAGSFQSEARPPRGHGVPRNPLELALVSLWENVLERRPVGIHDDFLEIGGHSLLALHLVAQVRRRFGVDLPLASFFSARTIAGMAPLLRAHQTAEPFSALVALQPEGALPPFFCVHPGGGSVFCYTALAYHLGSGRPFYGLQSQGLQEGHEPLSTVADMAGLYLESVQKVQPYGPYHLGGWSFGGLVAFEMANRLAASGEEMGLLALLDGGIRTFGEEEEKDNAKILSDLLGLEIGVSAEELRLLGSLDAQLERSLEEVRKRGIPLDLDVPRARSLYAVYKANARAARTYEPAAYPGRVTLFRATDRPPHLAPPAEPTLGWGGLAGQGVDVVEIPARHENLVVEPQVRILAERLRERLAARK